MTLNRTCLSRCARALARRVRSSFVAGGPSPHRLARKVAFHFHVPFPVPSSARVPAPRSAQRAFTIRASTGSAGKRISWQVEGECNRDPRFEKKKKEDKIMHASRANDRVRKVSTLTLDRVCRFDQRASSCVPFFEGILEIRV